MLDALYEIYHKRLGWLSYLSEQFGLDFSEIAYLEWLDECQVFVDTKLSEWEDEIESYGGVTIYFEADESKQLLKLTTLVQELEETADLKVVNRLVGTRYRLRNHLMKKVMPHLVEEVTDADIERARKVPLWRLMSLDRPKTIKCPYHDDQNPSFQVNLWGFCHTCRKYLDGIDYFMEKSNCTFLQAVRDLGDRYLID